MGIEQSLERIAIALEKIANPLLKLEGQQVTLAAPTSMKEADLPAQQAATGTPAKNDREVLMEQLDALKLPYPAKASTKRLKEILATHGPAKEAAKKPAAEMFDTPAAAKTVPLPTVDQARDHLKRFAAKFGSDKAVKILTDFKAANVTAIAQAGLLSEFVAEVLKQEKDNERK